jgi:hypothetical protein
MEKYGLVDTDGTILVMPMICPEWSRIPNETHPNARWLPFVEDIDFESLPEEYGGRGVYYVENDTIHFKFVYDDVEKTKTEMILEVDRLAMNAINQLATPTKLTIYSAKLEEAKRISDLSESQMVFMDMDALFPLVGIDVASLNLSWHAAAENIINAANAFTFKMTSIEALRLSTKRFLQESSERESMLEMLTQFKTSLANLSF